MNSSEQTNKKKKCRKAIILAGGLGTRLNPITIAINKHLLPIVDKPMIYYPLSLAMLANIRDVIIVTTSDALAQFSNLLKDGEELGMKISYVVQDQPLGIVDAIRSCKTEIGNADFMVLLGDNLFYGPGLTQKLNEIKKSKLGSVFAYEVNNPQDFGVLEFNNNVPSKIVEKPMEPKSNWVLTGLYYYKNTIWSYIDQVKISDRGEYEISDLNQLILENSKLDVIKLGRGFTWLDTGTTGKMLEAANFINFIQMYQGFQVACIEEIALNNQWITKNELLEKIKNKKSDYYRYIKARCIE